MADEQDKTTQPRERTTTPAKEATTEQPKVNAGEPVVEQPPKVSAGAGTSTAEAQEQPEKDAVDPAVQAVERLHELFLPNAVGDGVGDAEEIANQVDVEEGEAECPNCHRVYPVTEAQLPSIQACVCGYQMVLPAIEE